MTNFDLRQIARMTGCPYSSADAYCEAWGVQPSIRDSRKPKRQVRVYSRRDAFAFYLAHAMHRGGASLTAVKKAARFGLKARVEARLAAGYRYLAANRDDLWLVGVGETLLAEGRGAVAILLDLKAAYEEFQAQAAAVAAPPLVPMSVN